MNARNRPHDHRHWISNPDIWEAYPLLPMTRPTPTGFGTPECAVLVAPAEDGRFRLYARNIFDFHRGPLAPQLERCRVFDYPTADAVLADGWKVD